MTPCQEQRSAAGHRDAATVQGRLSGRRLGVTLVEVIVVLAIIFLASLFLLVMMSSGREEARLLGCRKNLGQIGVALAMYDQSHERLPTIMALSGVNDLDTARWPGPLRAMLETLQIPDFSELDDPNALPHRRPGQVPFNAPMPGLVCASDPNAISGWFTAPISYRATTGDTPAGDDGAFAIGRVMRLQDVEAAAGLAFTAGFSERLVGDHQPEHPALGNYRVVSGPLASSACPVADEPDAWRGDAGASWAWSDYRHTLYNHALPPNASGSCLAADGKTALIGASSGHVRGVNLLVLDGSVKVVTRQVDQKVWTAFANIVQPTRPNP